MAVSGPGAGRQRGVALITVLLVVALATVAATDMTREGQLDRRRTANRLALEQAHAVAIGGEEWAMAILGRDRRGESRGREGGGDPSVDGAEDNWAQQLPPIPIEGGQVGGSIIDLQGRFNVNGLVTSDDRVDAEALARFERLLTTLEIAPEVAQAVVDWIDPNGQTTYPGGAEDDFYLGREDPYRAANRPLATASELRLVRGIDAAAWARLQPHVTALPEATPINVNTASPAVLSSLSEELDAGTAEALAEVAREEPFSQVSGFVNHPLVRDMNLSGAGLAVRSSHFRVRIDVVMGPLEYTLYSWVERGNNGRSRVVRRARTPG